MYKGSIKPNVGGEKRPPKGVKEVARGGGPPEATMGNKSELALSLLTRMLKIERNSLSLSLSAFSGIFAITDLDIVNERGKESRLWNGKGDE